MNIRRATLEQAHACAAIYNYWVDHSTATFDTMGRDETAVREWYAAHDDERFPLLAATDDVGDVIGWGTLTAWSDRIGYRHTGEISIFTSADHQRRGVALAIGEALIEHAERAGLRVLLARLEASNEPSRGLFAKLGFTEVGTMHAVGFKFGRWLDVLVLERDLGEPEALRAALGRNDAPRSPG